MGDITNIIYEAVVLEANDSWLIDVLETRDFGHSEPVWFHVVSCQNKKW